MLKYRGEEFPFEGINGEMDGRGYENATEFYNKTDSIIFSFESCNGKHTDVVHTLFMNTILDNIRHALTGSITDYVLELDEIIESSGVEGQDFNLNVVKSRYNYRKGFVTYFKLVAIIDYLMIPITSVGVGKETTQLKYGDTVMIEVATTNRRFPPFVSERIVTGEIEKLNERQVLAYKLLDIDSIQNYGIDITFVNYKGV